MVGNKFQQLAIYAIIAIHPVISIIYTKSHSYTLADVKPEIPGFFLQLSTFCPNLITIISFPVKLVHIYFEESSDTSFSSAKVLQQLSIEFAIRLA